MRLGTPSRHPSPAGRPSQHHQMAQGGSGYPDTAILATLPLTSTTDDVAAAAAANYVRAIAADAATGCIVHESRTSTVADACILSDVG